MRKKKREIRGKKEEGVEEKGKRREKNREMGGKKEEGVEEKGKRREKKIGRWEGKKKKE